MGCKQLQLSDYFQLVENGLTKYRAARFTILASHKGAETQSLLFNDMLGTAITAFGESSSSAKSADMFFTGQIELAKLTKKPATESEFTNGNWQTADPLGYPDGWNNLAYVNNGVTSAIDWLGALKEFKVTTSSVSNSTTVAMGNRAITTSVTLSCPAANNWGTQRVIQGSATISVSQVLVIAGVGYSEDLIPSSITINFAVLVKMDQTSGALRIDKIYYGIISGNSGSSDFNIDINFSPFSLNATGVYKYSDYWFWKKYKTYSGYASANTILSYSTRSE